MTQEKEALRMALEALERKARCYAVRDELQISMRDAIVAIKEALAQPEQEPCDMGKMCIGCSPRNADGSCPDAQQEPVAIADGTFNHNCPVGTPLYTTPPQRMTDEGIKKLLEFYYRFGFTKASETTHKIRGLQDYTVCITDGLEDTSKPHTEIAPRTWVDLTKKEVLAISKINMDIIDMIYFVEAKVREKNYG